jgi:hypothetical protein
MSLGKRLGASRGRPQVYVYTVLYIINFYFYYYLIMLLTIILYKTFVTAVIVIQRIFKNQRNEF